MRETTTSQASSSLTLEQAFRQAVSHQQAGRLREAEELYRAILQAQPNQPDVNHNLGVLAGQAGQAAAGLPYLKAALEADPSQGQYWLSYAGGLLSAGQAVEAQMVMQTALQNGLDTPEARAMLQQAEAVVGNQDNDRVGRREADRHETPCGRSGMPCADKKEQMPSLSGKKKQNRHKSKSGRQLPQGEYNQLVSLFNAGRLPELERQAQLLSKEYPASGFVWKVLGASLQAQGKDSLASLQKAAELLPNDAVAHFNLGIARMEHDGLDQEAAASFRKAIALKPDFVEAHNSLGNALYEQGRLEDAVASLRCALQLKPGLVEVHGNLGNALRGLGQYDDALQSYRRALELRPGYAEAHKGLGDLFVDQDRLDEAIASYREAVALNPDDAIGQGTLGLLFQRQGKFNEAIACFRQALALKPDYAEMHGSLGLALHAQNRIEEAIESYCRAIELKPEDVETYKNMGSALRVQGRLERALEYYRKALAFQPDNADTHVGLANVHMDMGQFETARSELSRALEIQPRHPLAWSILPSLRKMTLDDSDWLGEALGLVSRSSPAPSPHEASMLQFAIGKYYDDTKQYDLAFAAYHQGHELRRHETKTLDRAGLTRLVDTLVSVYTTDETNRQREGASQSERPVLVVGMPRSGTSLIEQIIASHPNASGAGELRFWGLQAKVNRGAVLSANFGPELIAGIAAEYEQLLQGCSNKAVRIVDKMPGNFTWLGLIHAVFPQARIIHTQRNPIDTCLSIYFQNFRFPFSYASGLDDMAYYYREYARLMRHWRSVLPADRFLEVPYEALVDDQETWSRRMIEFIGLEWDERCLDFHETKRKVGTSSNWQVRQKIYRTSKARWKNYEKHLGPLRDLLELTG
jgi:tetratricopeptide (TPR) repeat protein